MTEKNVSAKSSRMKDVPRNLKGYFLCLMRKGPQWNETGDSPELMLAHLAFLRTQLEARRFMITGPVVDNADDLVGITLLQAESLEEASQLANDDPGARAGRLKMELRPVFLPSLDAVRVEY
jgi:uncharacterized protein YciI